jgi:hypothetical protein
MNLRLQEILEERKNKLPVVSPAIQDIHNRTVRTITNKIAGEKEFVNKVGKYYPKGSLYHVHYTNDKRTYYMTGGEHNERTKLLFRTNIFDNDFDYYNILNKQENLNIESKITPPTEQDYKIGKMTRYFAKKSNGSNSPVVEVSEEDFDSSPLYTYVSLEWYIKGDKNIVFRINKDNVSLAAQTIPNISKILPDYQYYRSDKVLSAKEEVLERLGKSSEQNEVQETTTTTQTTTQTTTTSNTQDSTPYYTGAPPGVTSGGAGGGSY